MNNAFDTLYTKNCNSSIGVNEGSQLNSEKHDDGAIEFSQNDRDAALRAIAQNWPDLEATSPKYVGLLELLATFHQRVGTEKFELRYNLRPPRNRAELWTKQFFHDQITESEYRDLCKADAERPIDLEMLSEFCDAYQDNLAHYSGVLQSAVLMPSESGTSAWQVREKAIDEHVFALKGKLPLWRENLETVFVYLEEMRITSGSGLIKLGEFEGTSAHWVAQLLFSRVIQAWDSCREISARSHVDRRYLYAAKAIDLFAESWRATFPTPQSVRERLREEFILARAALRKSAVSTSLIGSGSISVTTAEESIDNESRDLILIGDMYSIVGKAGHIFRPTPNSDWGIDGEIEFKDRAGNASGRRLYVQLKSGDSHLVERKRGTEEVFTVKKQRHLQYWVQHQYPVMLVIRKSTGAIRWMDVSAYLKKHESASRQIVFEGEPLTTDCLRKHAEKWLERTHDSSD